MGNICNGEQIDENQSKSLRNTYFQSTDVQPYAPIKPVIQNQMDAEYSLQIGVCFDKSEIISQEICIQQWQGLLWKQDEMDARKPTDLQKALYIIHKNQPERFEEVLEQAGGGQIRWFVWKTLLFSCIKQKHKAMKLRQYDRMSVIERDVKRTFPRYLLIFKSHPYFQLESQSSQKLSQLLHLIGATFTDIGYTQGMNFVLAFILMQSGGNVEEAWSAAFIMFYSAKWMLYGMYMNEFPLTKLICEITKELLKQYDLQVYTHYMKLEIDDIFLLCKWQFTLYLYNIPAQACLNFWDLILSKGIFIMAAINCQLLITIRSQILSFSNSLSFLELSQQLQETNVFSNYKDIKNRVKQIFPSKKLILSCISNMKGNYSQTTQSRSFLNNLEQNLFQSNCEQKYQQWMENNIRDHSQ